MSEPGQTRESGEEPETDEEVSRLAMLWNQSWSALFKALGLSLVIHLLLAGLVMLNPSLPFNLEMGWEGRMGELTGIGHGSTDFDRDEEVDWDEMAEFQQTRGARVEEASEEEADVDDELDEDPEEIDEAAEEEALPEESELVETEPAEVDDDAEVDDRPGEEPAPEASPEVEESESEDEAPPQRTAREILAQGIPGVDRGGPSNLPDMRNYGPGNARVTALFRTDRMRDTEIGDLVGNLLKAVPDYRIALEGTDLDPVNELDSIFMASSNPEYLHNTFLAARHRYDNNEMQAILNNRLGDPIEWEIEGERPVRPLVPESARYSDPRRLMLVSPGLMLMGQPHWFEELMGPVDENSPLGRELAEAEDGPSVYTLLDGLAQIEEVAERDDTLVLFSAYGVSFKDAPILNQIPPIQGLRLSVNDINAPRLTIDLHMRTERGAREMVEKCPDLRNQASFLANLFGVGALIRPLRCSQQGDYVVIEGQYTQEQLIDILRRAPDMMGAVTPRALRGLPTSE